MWTSFFDMSSGGSEKLEWSIIYIEADKDEAIQIFENKFGRDLHHITCDCCGSDYVVSTYETLEEASKFHGRAGQLVLYKKNL